MTIKHYLISSAVCLVSLQASAQLSSNPDKFLGNITSRYQMDYDGIKFSSLWNQVTPENESKWGSVEGTRGQFNWGCDTPFNYAKKNKFTYKFHAFVWGAQYPNWLPNLSIKDRYNAIVNWVDHVKAKYDQLPMIDVVNEAVGSHQAGNSMMKESLGGGGKTGYDWLIKAFELAYERFPNSILIYNDYNTFQWDTDNYIKLVQALRDAGAPIDAYGCQAHDLKGVSLSSLKSVDTKIQNALKMPMFISEYDIQNDNDEQQRNDFKNHISYFWEKEYCAGITLWGWVYGCTWNENQSGIIKNKKDRLAMTWLREYMASDTAKTAKSPYPGMKKHVGVYVRPKDFKVAKGDVLPIKVRTHITDDAKKENPELAIDKVELYDGTTLIATMTEEPYITEYQLPSTATGTRTLKAIVYTNDSNTYERLARVAVQSGTTKRAPFNDTPIELPGTINTAEYDKGVAGVSYNNGIGRKGTTAAQDGGWMEYTVDVKETGIYSFDAEVAAAKAGGVFHISEYGFDDLTYYSDFVDVPATGGTTNYQTMHGVFKKELTAGRHTLCLNTDKGGFYIKSLTLNRYDEDANITCTISRSPATVTVGDKTTVTVKASSKNSTIANVKVFANDLLIGTLTEAPYTLDYEPTTPGKQILTAIATDADGKSKTSAKSTLTVNAKREPYSGVIAIPGTIEGENYDMGGEGFSYHDSDTKNEGNANFRTSEGIDIETCTGGRAIGYTAKNEWTEYTVNVTEPGEYSFEATCSNGSNSNGGFSINLVKGTTVTKIGTVAVTPTGGWNTYKVMKGKLTKNLSVGEQIVRFTITDANCNIDKVKFICTLNTGISDVELTPDAQHSTPSFNLSGQKVGDGYRGIIIRNGRKVIKR